MPAGGDVDELERPAPVDGDRHDEEDEDDRHGDESLRGTISKSGIVMPGGGPATATAGSGATTSVMDGYSDVSHAAQVIRRA